MYYFYLRVFAFGSWLWVKSRRSHTQEMAAHDELAQLTIMGLKDELSAALSQQQQQESAARPLDEDIAGHALQHLAEDARRARVAADRAQKAKDRQSNTRVWGSVDVCADVWFSEGFFTREMRTQWLCEGMHVVLRRYPTREWWYPRSCEGMHCSQKIPHWLFEVMCGSHKIPHPRVVNSVVVCGDDWFSEETPHDNC